MIVTFPSIYIYGGISSSLFGRMHFINLQFLESEGVKTEEIINS